MLLMEDLERSAVDEEQDAGNDSANTGNHCQRKSSKVYPYQDQAIQDQERAQQNPLDSFHVHLDLSFLG